ncbi:hypothetical protein AB0H18_31325 [Streptomyces sp. NPDC020766]|uniref:hypothetical protein n=1 Tax=Streptomyces sp. NPDC020766 TaxID=3155011 RepID=UPI0033C45A3F
MVRRIGPAPLLEPWCRGPRRRRGRTSAERATSVGGDCRRARSAGWIRRVATMVRISSTLATKAPVLSVTAL